MNSFRHARAAHGVSGSLPARPRACPLWARIRYRRRHAALCFRPFLLSYPSDVTGRAESDMDPGASPSRLATTVGRGIVATPLWRHNVCSAQAQSRGEHVILPSGLLNPRSLRVAPSCRVCGYGVSEVTHPPYIDRRGSCHRDSRHGDRQWSWTGRSHSVHKRPGWLKDGDQRPLTTRVRAAMRQSRPEPARHAASATVKKVAVLREAARRRAPLPINSTLMLDMRAFDVARTVHETFRNLRTNRGRSPRRRL